MTMLQAALTWYNAGCSVIPIRSDGTKRPMVEWKPFTTGLAAAADVAQWWNPSSKAGVGVVCGAVSGGLEMLELEGRAGSSEHFDKIYQQCDVRNISWLFDVLTQQGYCESTPSGGYHFLYRITDHEVPGNTKVARRPATEQELLDNPSDKIKVLSETRGEGGYVIVAPTHGTVHPSGDSWSIVAGELGVIPLITWTDRNLLHEAVHAALDEMPAPVVPAAPVRAHTFRRDGLSPGDDFNDRAEWEEILTPHGWRVAEFRGDETFWIRPGKKFEGRGSHSATTGFKGAGATDRLYVFSTSTVFDAEKPYNKFAAYTLLEHGGNFADAARELSRRGYGTRASAPSCSTTPMPMPTPPSFAETVAVIPARVIDTPTQPIASGTDLIQASPKFPAIGVKTLERNEWSDNGACDMYAETFHPVLRHVGDQDVWRTWNGVTWEHARRGEHKDAMRALAHAASMHHHALKDAQDPREGAFDKFSRSINGMQRLAGIPKIASSHTMLATLAEDYDAHKHLITVDNGVLDLRSGQLQPHDPQLLLTKKLNTGFNPSKGAGRWGTFMEEVLPDPAVRGYLQRALGYALTGAADQRAIFLLHGPSGSGKSQVIEAMAQIFSDYATALPAGALRPKQQSGPADDVHTLQNSRFAYQSELPENALLNEALIKAATGGDTLTTRELYGKWMSWKPEFVIFLATNYLPRVSSTDDAVWRRVKPIKFEQCFIDGDGNPLSPDAAGIGVRIATEEPECVLNWLLEGLAAYRQEGLTSPKQVQEWTQGYRNEVDTVRQFLSEGQDEGRIKVESNLETGFRELYRAYAAWCTDNYLRPLPSGQFTKAMEAGSWERRKRERGIMWQGIGLAGFILESQTSVHTQGQWGMRT